MTTEVLSPFLHTAHRTDKVSWKTLDGDFVNELYSTISCLVSLLAELNVL